MLLDFSSSRSGTLVTAILVVGALASCGKKSSSAEADATATRPSPAAPAAPAPTPPGTASAESSVRRAARDLESLTVPPLKPPAKALDAPLGVRWEPLRKGSGAAPTAVTDTVVAEYSVWTTDGKLADSSYSADRSAVFHMSRIGQAFHALMAQIQAGGSARFWVPRAALQGWRPETWPDSDLVIELEILSVHPNALAKPSKP
jgi:hypothetical protein